MVSHQSVFVVSESLLCNYVCYSPLLRHKFFTLLCLKILRCFKIIRLQLSLLLEFILINSSYDITDSFSPRHIVDIQYSELQSSSYLSLTLNKVVVIFLSF